MKSTEKEIVQLMNELLGKAFVLSIALFALTGSTEDQELQTIIQDVKTSLVSRMDQELEYVMVENNKNERKECY